MIDPEELQKLINQYIDVVYQWMVSPHFYIQSGAILAAFIISWLLFHGVIRRFPLLKKAPEGSVFFSFRQALFDKQKLIHRLLDVLLLEIAIESAQAVVKSVWLIKIAQSLAVVFLLYNVIRLFIKNPFINGLSRWIGIPIATLHVFGWLGQVIEFMDSLAIQAGNIRVSAYLLFRVVIFGSILIWLGNLSNGAGQKLIRSRAEFDSRSREVFAKLFEIFLYVAVFLVLLQVVGIDLTALAVFGGALGVGLGFGLQQIASNFISGIIILLDRSLSLGDYIELENGKAGILQEMNMRSATLKTYDGKSVVVPNEQFITTSFTNWTHQDKHQRYDFEFSVSYGSDIPKIPELIISTIEKHPKVLQVPEKPDCEIRSFGDNGVVFGVEYWIEGIDDGENRVEADLLMMIWIILKEHNIEIPFPQRDVRIIQDKS